MGADHKSGPGQVSLTLFLLWANQSLAFQQNVVPPAHAVRLSMVQTVKTTRTPLNSKGERRQVENQENLWMIAEPSASVATWM